MAIAWMIYLTEGIRSPYYAGMNIVMVAVVLLIPFALAEASIFCAFVIICYASACWLHVAHPPHQEQINGGLSSGRTLTSNLYFLGGTMVLSLTASHFASIRRFVDFRLRHELDTNNRELASTLNKLKETEVQLVQSEKMNALGKLSAGLLHEVNNPLNFMFMAMQIAEQEVGDNASLRDTLKDIGEGMGRIRTVISDLRAFAHPTHELAMQQFPLDEALTSALRLTAHELGTIPVDRQGISGITAMGASTQIVHVFMNLLINSAHAVKHKAGDKTAQIKVYATEANGRLQVAVRDNGTGVAPVNLPKLLDPFFTTKDVGQGMGLGLSICHTIVKNHGGAMIVTSELGAWTEVKFDLPLDRAPAKPAEPEAQPDAQQVRSRSMTPAQQETQKFGVLYVDDEEQALKYFRKGMGTDFTIHTANGVEPALAILAKEAANIGIVITDQRHAGPFRRGASHRSQSALAGDRAHPDHRLHRSRKRRRRRQRWSSLQVHHHAGGFSAAPSDADGRDDRLPHHPPPRGHGTDALRVAGAARCDAGGGGRTRKAPESFDRRLTPGRPGGGSHWNPA